LFLTEEIEHDWRTGQVRSQYQSLIWRITWEALVSGHKEGLWAFDAAILPEHLFDSYKDFPKDIFICKDKEVMYVARKSVWGTEPWDNID
jgi:hypothetical protein